MSQLNIDDMKAYNKVVNKIESALIGEELDHIVPALSALLGLAFAQTDMPKKACITYAVESIDRAFEVEKK